VRLEQASVSLNDRLAGAAPGNRACMTPVPLGRREAPRQRLEFRGRKPRNARISVPCNDWLGDAIRVVKRFLFAMFQEIPARVR